MRKILWTQLLEKWWKICDTIMCVAVISIKTGPKLYYICCFLLFIMVYITYDAAKYYYY